MHAELEKFFTSYTMFRDLLDRFSGKAKSKRKGKRDRDKAPRFGQARASRAAVSTYTTLQRAGVLLEEKIWILQEKLKEMLGAG